MKASSLYHDVRAQWLAYAVFFAVVLLVPLFITDGYRLNLLSTYGVYAMLALSVSLGWGAGGILNLGQGIPFGLGAYGMAMTMQMQSQDASNPIPPFMLNNSLTQLPWFWEPFASTGTGIALALLVPTLFWAAFGSMMFAARVSGGFVAVMTLAMLSAMNLLILDVQAYTNGANGITPPNPLQVFGTAIDPYSQTGYLVVAVLLAALAGLSKLMLQSKFGMITHAVRSDPERTRFLGYNVSAYQTVLFGFSGLIAACAGCLFVMLVQYVSPAQLDVSFSVGMVIWVAVGGRLSLLCSMLGALLLNGAQTVAGDTFLNTWLLMLGLFFVIVVRFLPQGLAGLVEAALQRLPWPLRRAPAARSLHLRAER